MSPWQCINAMQHIVLGQHSASVVHAPKGDTQLPADCPAASLALSTAIAGATYTILRPVVSMKARRVCRLRLRGVAEGRFNSVHHSPRAKEEVAAIRRWPSVGFLRERADGVSLFVHRRNDTRIYFCMDCATWDAPP